MPLARTLLAAALVTQLSIFATTVYLHRILAHRSLSVRPAVALVFQLVISAITAAVTAVGHTYGQRPYDTLATNNQWLAWISGGEGLHNNHHAAPTSARFALAGGQIDPGWWLIRLLLTTKQAEVRHEELKLKQPA